MNPPEGWLQEAQPVQNRLTPGRRGQAGAYAANAIDSGACTLPDAQCKPTNQRVCRIA